jgi:hypothetical protein
LEKFTWNSAASPVETTAAASRHPNKAVKNFVILNDAVTF